MGNEKWCVNCRFFQWRDDYDPSYRDTPNAHGECGKITQNPENTAAIHNGVVATLRVSKKFSCILWEETND